MKITRQFAAELAALAFGYTLGEYFSQRKERQRETADLKCIKPDEAARDAAGFGPTPAP